MNKNLTLRTLICSADVEKYKSHPLFLQLSETKPEFGSSQRIVVRKRDGNITVSNVHIGSLGDILTYPIDIEGELQLADSQLLDAILSEMMRSNDSYDADFWNEMTNLQKAKILR